MNEYMNRMLNNYNDIILPNLQAFNAESTMLLSLVNNIPTIIKDDITKRIQQQPLINSARLPIILAQSLGDLYSDIKKIINNLLSKNDVLIKAVNDILNDAIPMFTLLNQAMGENFVNPAIITGLNGIKQEVSAIRSILMQVKQGITDALSLPADMGL
jgi:hypothetical protein